MTPQHWTPNDDAQLSRYLSGSDAEDELWAERRAHTATAIEAEELRDQRTLFAILAGLLFLVAAALAIERFA